MSSTRWPEFNSLARHYPKNSDIRRKLIDGGAGDYLGTAPLLWALETTKPGFLTPLINQKWSVGAVKSLFCFCSAGELAEYLRGPEVGWNYYWFNGHQAKYHAAKLSHPGVIFWKLLPREKQLVLQGHAHSDHIDLWDPVAKTLAVEDGRTMLWEPAGNIVEYAWFWRLPRRRIVQMVKPPRKPLRYPLPELD